MHRHTPAEFFPVRELACALSLRARILREQVGREAGRLRGWSVGVTSVFPTILATTH